MTVTALKTPPYDPDKTKSITLKCPFCGHEEETAWDGLYRPRYFDCGLCGERYVYEPLADRVACEKPGEVACCDDPECRD